jgi:ubiquinone biosynthesis accessory factor UbiJ
VDRLDCTPGTHSTDHGYLRIVNNHQTMQTPSPLSFLDDLFKAASNQLQPPLWLVEELQRRVVLLLNHVLMQEPQAMARLVRQKGRVVQAQWLQFSMTLVATPAGLLDLAEAGAEADLVVTVTEASPMALAQAVLKGDKPGVRIEGDVQLAAEINWLVDHVRWDLEEDLSRILGDAPAHAIGQAVRAIADALRRMGQGAASAAARAAPTQPTAPAAPEKSDK